jgi:hypothetical protein
MPDYSKGKVYKIVANTDEEYKPYVGSTCQDLSQRMTDHRKDYKRWKNGIGFKYSSFDLFDKFGIEKCQIILLEEYSCDNKMKLLMKEREWFDKMECCNKLKPLKNEEEKSGSFHYQRTIELHPSHNQEHYKRTIELNPNHNKERYQKRKVEMNKKRKESFTCDCGSIYRKCHKARHERTLKHQNYLSSLKV